MRVLLTAHDSPYGTSERLFNALRLAAALQKQPEPAEVRLFLASDAVYAGMRNQLRPDGQYNVEEMVRSLLEAGAQVTLCQTCVDHRGLFGVELIPGVRIGSMMELAEWTLTSDRVIGF